MRVIVTGSRLWTDEAAVTTALSANTNLGDTLIVGDAEGVDAIATDFWRARGPIEVFAITPREWAEYGRRAGPRRNAAMVASGADLCLAFMEFCQRCHNSSLPHATHGTVNCATQARRAGIPVRRYGPASGLDVYRSEWDRREEDRMKERHL